MPIWKWLFIKQKVITTLFFSVFEFIIPSFAFIWEMGYSYIILLLHSYVNSVCVCVSNCLILQLCLLTLIVKKYQVTVRCNKMEIDATAEDRFCRRDILKCAGVTIGMVRALLLYLNHKFCLYQFHFFGFGFWNSSKWMNLAVYSITHFK